MNAQRPSGTAKTAYFLVNLMLVLLLLGLVLAIADTVVGLARGGNTLLGGRTLPVHAALPQEQLRSLPDGVRLTRDPEVTLEVKDPSAAQLLLSTGSGVGPFVLLAGALWLLRGLARSVREGDPFGPANVQRLRALGFLLVAGAPVVELVSWALRLSLANTLPPDAFGDVGFPAHGVRLREDVEGTV